MTIPSYFIFPYTGKIRCTDLRSFLFPGLSLKGNLLHLDEKGKGAHSGIQG